MESVYLQRLLPYIQELFKFGTNLNVNQWHNIIFLKSDFQSLRYLPSIISEPWEGCECEFAISFVKTSDTKWQHKPWFSPLKYVHIWDIRIFFNDFHLIVKVQKWLIYCNKHAKYISSCNEMNKFVMIKQCIVQKLY